MKKNIFRDSLPKLLISLFLIMPLIIITGCESIPPGTPPEGPIVSINATNEKPLTPKNAINDMTTAIATSSILYEYGDVPTVNLKVEKVPEELKDIDKNLGYLTSHLFRSLVEMDMVKLPLTFNSSKVDFTIFSNFSRNYENIDLKDDDIEVVNWNLELLSPEKRDPLWKQNLKVMISKKVEE